MTHLHSVTLLAKGAGLRVPGFLPRTILIFVYTIIARRLIDAFSSEVQEIITDPYILFVGTFCPHKNLESLIHAYEVISRKTDRSLKLVLVGHEVNVRRRKLSEVSE